MQAARELYQFDTYEAYEEHLLNSRMQFTHQKIEKQKRHTASKKAGLYISKSLMYTLLFFGVLSLVLYRYSVIFEAKYNNHELMREANQMEIQLSEMKAQLDSIVVLENVEKVAVQELGMQYPTNEQTIYLDNPWKYKLDKKHVQKAMPQVAAKGLEFEINAKLKAVASIFEH